MIRLLALSAALVALAPLPAQADAVATCRGLPATIVATSGTVTGTPGDDVIVVSGSVTVVDPGAGSDTVCLDGVRATVRAGDDDTGNDVVDTTGNLELEATVELGGGSNTFIGGGGEDTVLIGHTPDAPSSDVIDTGTGADVVEDVGPVASLRLDTGRGADTLRLVELPATGAVDLGTGLDQVEVELSAATHGRPAVTVDLPHDRVRVGGRQLHVTGSRNVFVSARTVTLLGDGADNQLFANACRATIRGGRGDDNLALVRNDASAEQQCGPTPRSRQYGGAGNDVLQGLGGPDLLVGGPGHDRAYGLAGVDRCSAEVTQRCEEQVTS